VSPERPLISVILPVKDGESWLAEAIESVLSQEYPRLELIVIDGQSTDRSAEIARSYSEVRYLAQDEPGLAQGWNQGVEAAKGDLIAFLDCDDRWTSGKLAAQTGLLRQRPELAGAIGMVSFFLTPGQPPPSGMRPQLLEGEHVAQIPGALLVRREVFEQIGNFDTSYEIAIDVDWFARVKDAGLEFGVVPQVVLEKRFHSANLSHARPDRYHQEMVRAMRESAARQRAAVERS
jgi:glycosyltransferase involved in cell wall biosynthesis